MKTIDDYIKTGGLRCPCCDSGIIDGNGCIEGDANCAWQEVECCDCGAVWRDIYTLTDYEIIKEGK